MSISLINTEVNSLMNYKSVKSSSTDVEDSVLDQQSVILTIARENQVSQGITLKSLTEAVEVLNEIKSEIQENPKNALLAQGNLLSDIVTKVV